MTRQPALSRTMLLRTLSDGQFHSGQDLGAQLGVSRAAVSKHIKALSELGLDIFSVTGKGYRLAKPLNLLEHKSIVAKVQHRNEQSLAVLNVIDSTNQYLKQRLPNLTNGFVCLAEAQTQGRGRHGRRWVSPYGASLYLSMYWQFAGGYQAINGLSLVMGLAVTNALQSLAIQGVQLKWPNDVYLNDKKLAGVLIEVEGQLGVECDCIIGIGLNIDLPERQDEIDQPWTDLYKATGQAIDRNQLAAALINELYIAVQHFEQHGLAPFVEQWQHLDLYKNQPIRVLSGKHEKSGLCRGINHQGALLLETSQGLEVIHGGEVSVRGRN